MVKIAETAAVRVLAAGALAVFCVACAAHRPDRSGTRWQGVAGEFGASMLITDDHDQLLRDWARAPASFDLSALPVVGNVRKGQKAYAVIFFVNCLDAKDDRCELRSDFSVSNPDGSRYGGYQDRTLWSGARPARDSISLAVPYLLFKADPEDAEGAYTFSARIRSPDASTTVELARTLIVHGSDDE